MQRKANVKAAKEQFEQGVEYRSQKKFGPAMTCFGRAIELDDKQPKFYFARALMLQHFNDFDSALTDYRRVLNLNPTHKAALKEFKNCLGKGSLNGDAAFKAIKHLKNEKLQISVLNDCVNPDADLGKRFTSKSFRPLLKSMYFYLFGLQDEYAKSGNAFWLLQGPQLIKEGVITSEMFLHISTLLLPPSCYPPKETFIKVHNSLLSPGSFSLFSKLDSTQEENYVDRTCNILSRKEQKAELNKFHLHLPKKKPDELKSNLRINFR
jgi:hypothetical protein